MFLLFIFHTQRNSKQQLLRRRQQAHPDGLHAPPDPRAGEGVPLQPLPHAEAAHRDRAHAVPQRETDQDLVPEPADEVEEGAQAPQHQDQTHRRRGHGDVAPPRRHGLVQLSVHSGYHAATDWPQCSRGWVALVRLMYIYIFVCVYVYCVYVERYYPWINIYI